MRRPPHAVVLPCLVAALPVLSASVAAAAQEYTVAELGAAPGTPVAMNNKGQILFTDFEKSASLSGPASVLWSGGTPTTIGLLPGGTYSTAYGLNDAGQVVGAGDTFVTWELMDPVTFHTVHAFVWQGGGPADLDPSTEMSSSGEWRLFIGGSRAFGINNAGQVTGSMQVLLPGDKGFVRHAFVTPAGGQIDRKGDEVGLQLGATLYSEGKLINNRGQVLAETFPAGASPGYTLIGGGALPIPGPPQGLVYGINDAGVIVGEAGGRAFVYAAGGLQYPPVPGAQSQATAVNNHGQVVGTGDQPFLYANGRVIDLNGRLAPGSGWQLQSASLINDKGQILGLAARNGKQALVLLHPVDVTPRIVLQSDPSCPGDTVSGTVTIDQPAPSGGLLVQLSSDPPISGLPSGVTVTGGEKEQPFRFFAPMKPGKYQVTASVENDAGTSISPAATLVVKAPELVKLKLSDNEVCSDDQPMGTVTLSCPAPAGGIAVPLEIKNSSPLQIILPAAVTVAAGSSSASFPITPGFYNSKFSQEMVTISASYGGGTESADLTIQPTIDMVLLTPHSTTPGGTATAMIHLNCPAPKGGRAVVVMSSNPSAATVNADHPDQPLLVIIPEKSDTFQASVQTHPVSSAQTATISASTLASTDSDDLKVQPP